MEDRITEHTARGLAALVPLAVSWLLADAGLGDVPPPAAGHLFAPASHRMRTWFPFHLKPLDIDIAAMLCTASTD